MSRKLEKIFRAFLYALPVVLFFSYQPIIALGANETMNFELSLPLIWLVLFDILAIILLVQGKKLGGIRKKWPWLLFPLFVSLSIIWSPNRTRAILTVGMIWLVYLAIFAMVELREIYFSQQFREKLIKIFLISSLVICAFCLLQCVLDLAGVAREATLMCEGCSYRAFGFPHPNGFAIEPQFMGNLLLAPMLVAEYLWLGRREKKFLGFFMVFVATICLTFSRGAIYAGAIAASALMIYWAIREKTCRPLILGLVGIAAFLFTLNLQGIFAQVSKTNDTYGDGVAKAVEQLSLGVIKLRGEENERNTNAAETIEEVSNVTNEQASETGEEEVEAAFDGYVEESTNTRVRLSEQAAEVWAQDARTVMFGVGIGGAGVALYEHNLTAAPKEIIQNQYMSLLLETGVVGLILFLFSVFLAIRAVLKTKDAALILALMGAYGISLFFFSGLANALHIYLLTGESAAVSRVKYKK